MSFEFQITLTPALSRKHREGEGAAVRLAPSYPEFNRIQPIPPIQPIHQSNQSNRLDMGLQPARLLDSLAVATGAAARFLADLLRQRIRE